MKLLDLISDRNGKLSPFKLAWQVSCYGILATVIYQSIKSGSLVAIPENWISFMVTVSGAQLGKSYLVNKKEEIKTPPVV